MLRILTILVSISLIAGVGFAAESPAQAQVPALRVGQDFGFPLETNRKGYRWQLDESFDTSMLKVISSHYVPPGSFGKEEKWAFKALKPGKTTIVMKYIKQGEKDNPAAVKKYDVDILPSEFMDIEGKGYLGGIEEVRINPDGSVTLVEAQHRTEGLQIPGYGCSLERVSEKDPEVTNKSVTLKKGQSVLMTDGHHGSETFTFMGFIKDAALIRIKSEFNAISFGGGVHRSTKTIEVRPYKI